MGEVYRANVVLDLRRDLDDIFAVQDDIARSVVKELRTTLLGERPDPSPRESVKDEVEAAAKGPRGECGSLPSLPAREILRRSLYGCEHRQRDRALSAGAGAGSGICTGMGGAVGGVRQSKPPWVCAICGSVWPCQGGGRTRPAVGAGASGGPPRAGAGSNGLRLGLERCRVVDSACVDTGAGECGSRERHRGLDADPGPRTRRSSSVAAP